MINYAKCFKSFHYAFKGIKVLIKSENNARVHLLASILAITLGIVFSIKREEWLWLILAITLVWITEVFNTAFEKLADVISPEYNPVIGQVKDLTAAAVLLASVFSLITGAILFVPYLIRALNLNF